MSATPALPVVYASRKEAQRLAIADAQVAAGTAFYRKYTEQLLRRYMRTSQEMGRTPSLLGTMVFRGRASHMALRNFEDRIIFVHDVENCLKKLDRDGQELVARISLQQYTQGEVAVMLGASVRTVMRRYAETLDRLTDILLDVDLLKVPGCSVDRNLSGRTHTR